MKAIGVIPARLYSSRFPKKILHPIDGKPMVVHVYEQALKAKSLDDVIVAIDADETETSLNEWKVKTIMTSDNHVSGTDRIQEAVVDIEADVVVNIQGDEPTINPLLIDELVQQFEDKSIEMATVAGQDMDVEKIMDVNQNTTDLLMSKYPGYDLIHGHTHRQNTHNDSNYTRHVLGDWSTQKGNAIKLDNKLEWLEIN
jgi:CMP-2-keto-3-deoxyoctulosonic acid synthetase